MNAHDVLIYGQLTLQGALDGVPEGTWERPGVCGPWSVKDIVAHLASYELVLVDVIGSLVGVGPTPCLDRFRALGPSFNDAEVDSRGDMNVAAVVAELNAAHARTLTLIGSVPPGTARQSGTLPWYGDPYSLDDLIVYLAYGHKRQHTAQIAAFADLEPTEPAS